MFYLVGDIGGTNVRLRVVGDDRNAWRTIHEYAAKSREVTAIESAIAECLEQLPPEERNAVRGACLAVAGPVAHGRATMTNCDWRLDRRALADTFHFEFVGLINDFAAVAHGIPTMSQDELEVVRRGESGDGPCIALGPGTGLGQVMFRENDGAIEYFPSEGGHIGFSPLNDEQNELLRFLRASCGRVSYEQLLSGRGLTELHRFQCSRMRLPNSIGDAQDLAASVTHLAFANDPAAIAAVNLFWSILGAFAGDSVLIYVARGGVFLTGGILPRLPGSIGRPAFERAFIDKGPMSTLVASVPVRLVTADDLGLRGALAWLRQRLQHPRPFS